MLKKLDLFIFIILPVFNGEKYILQQLMSIYYQTFKNWNLIIVNDGSKDFTQSIIDNFVKNYHLQDKVKIINKENAGVNKAIETGLLEVQKLKEKFEGYDIFISYCDADDIWMRNKLEIELDFIQKNKGDLCFHDLILIDENDNYISRSYNKQLRTLINNNFDNSFFKLGLSNHITSTSMMFKYKYVKYIIPIYNGLYQDWFTSLIISGLYGKIISLDKPLAYYRRHSNSITSARNAKNVEEAVKGMCNVLNNIKGRLPIKNREICDYLVGYYNTRLNFKKENRITQIVSMLK